MTAADRSPDSFLAAMAKARIPAGNHEFIRSFTSILGISAYRAVERDDKPYAIAVRPDGLPDLHIYYGYTTGFTSEDEIVSLIGPDVLRDTSSRVGTWYVAHPINQVRPRGAAARHSRREAGICSCGMQLSLTGVCGSCD